MCKSGVLFMAEKSSIEKQLNMYFMKNELGIVDADFMKECEADAVNFLRKGFRKYSSKITSSYRKHLTTCECRLDETTTRTSVLFLFWAYHHFLPCYEKGYESEFRKLGGGEGREEASVRKPSHKTILSCFSKLPEDCDEEDIRDMTFFYHVALVAVDKRMKNEMLVAEQGGVMGVLNCPRLWASTMAFAVVLVANFSDLDNIIHNATLKRKGVTDVLIDSSNKDKNATDESEEASDGIRNRKKKANENDCETKKKKKKKMYTKSTQQQTSKLYTSTYNYFLEMKTGVPMQTEPGQEEQMNPEVRRAKIQKGSTMFIAWEKEVKILVNKMSAAARKPQSVVVPHMPDLREVAYDDERLQLDALEMFMEEAQQE